MTSSPYNKFFLKVGIGTNRKLRRLPVAQRWGYVAGVLSLAAQSPMRGALLIHDGTPVTAKDLAAEATISLQQARKTIASLHALGMLEVDSDGVFWVHDWDQINPDPRPSDSPEARRQRKRLQRERERAERGHANVTRDTPPMSRGEVEEEVKTTPPTPQEGGTTSLQLLPPAKPKKNRKRDLDHYETELAAWAARNFPGVPTSGVETAIGWARERGFTPTPDGLREFIEAAPNFAHLLEPAA